MLGTGGLLCSALMLVGLADRCTSGAREPAGPGASNVLSPAPERAASSAPFGRTTPVLPPARHDEAAGEAGADVSTADVDPAVAAAEPRGSLAARILARLPRALLEPRLAALRRERHARARFDRGVSEHEVRASQLAPAVKELFDSMDLEPVLDAEGMIEGLSIESLEPDSPMRGAGFRPSDRITRIAGLRLHDPADLPPLLVRLGTRIDLCVERAGEEICREIILD